MNQISRPLPMESDSISSLKSLSKVIGLFVIGVGCLVLLGWALDIPTLKSTLPGLASMKSNTALLFVLCGISLWMQVKGQTQRIAQACAFIVAFVGLITLGEYLFNSDFGIDQILFRDTAAGALHPGRMAPATALSFLLVGLSLILLDNQPGTWFNKSLVVLVFAISALVLIGYLYGVSSLYKIGLYSSMALHTALSFILLSIAILFARPERGLMKTILADTAGGNILRRLLPVVLVGPILLGWIRLWGQRAGLYDTAFGLAIMVTSLITTLTIFIWFNSGQLTATDIKRKQVNDNLRASELRFRSTLESMIEGCQIIGYDWRYLYLNDAAVKQSQLTRDKLFGRTMMECYPGIENSSMFSALRRCMEERTSHHMINEFIYPDGAKGWFELSIQPAPDGIFILSSDITKHKQAEQALLEREMKLSTLFEILPVGISIIDAERKVTYTNPALKKILDISDEGLLKGIYKNRKHLRANGTLMPVDELASMRAFKEKREIDGVETGVVKENDDIVWTDVSAVPVDFPDWKVVMVTSDITERKQAEERFRLAIEAAPNAIVMVDQQGQIILVNSQTEKYFGYEREELIAANIDKLVPARFRGNHASHRSGFFSQPQARPMGVGRDLYGLRKDGVEFPVEIGLAPIKTQQVMLVIATIVDITERKKAEMEILKLNAELEKKVAERTAELAAANKQLHELSIVDELTGLYNRRGFLLHAKQQLLLARRRAGRNILVFYADLDGLKQINDHLGHIAGDKALLTAAHALNETFRTSDIKARLGGDEFIVLAVDAGGNCAQALTARLYEKLAENKQSMSVGVVSFNAKNETSMDDIIARADAAMYAEKRKKSGRREM